MELIFATKNYASKLSKTADIETNDPVQPKLKIMFSANILIGPDSLAISRYTPDMLEFVKGGQKSQSVVFSNHGESPIHLTLVSTPPKALEVKNKPFDLKPTEIKKLDFKWKGEFTEKDSNISLTFEVQSDSARRFTIPIVVKSTKPPEPKPALKEKPKAPNSTVKPKEPIKKEAILAPSEKKWPIPSDTTQASPEIKK